MIIHTISFFLRGIRGGISFIGHPYAKSRNRFITDNDFENKEEYIEEDYIFFCDLNNQYGWAMSQHLPEKNFEWDDSFFDENLELVQKKILNVSDDSPTGYIFEVDLRYPDHIHNLHNEFPLCPEVLEIKSEWLSKYQRSLKENLQIKGKSKKLCLTLFDKKNYVIHYRNLKFCLDSGLILSKVHRVLKFDQSQWLKSYIDLNTKLRQNATSKFEESFSKLMNNSVYGKTCENVRKYSRAKLATNEVEVNKLLRSPLVANFRIYHENLACFQMYCKSVTLNKPRYVGLTVLDLSKLLMYRFYYEYFLKKFKNVKVLLSDTDSFCFHIRTSKNFYNEIKEDTNWFDFSNYSRDHPNYNKNNFLVPGKMKDEMAGKIIEEFAGLRSKMYSVKVKDNHGKKTAKGLMKSMQKSTRHEDYLMCIDDEDDRLSLSFTGKKIHSENHENFLVEVTKKGLCAYNDKKYIKKKGLRDFQCISFGNFILNLDNFSPLEY